MGDVLNWRMPIEWDDGTAAQITKDDRDWLGWNEGEGLTSYRVQSEHEPRGWNRRTMPKLGLLSPVMVNPDGTLDFARGPDAPYIRNIEMPLLRFPDGTEPKRVSIVDDATRLVLQHDDGSVFNYVWPRLIPKGAAPKLVEITPAMVEAEEKAVAEQSAMEENPYFGMF